LPLLDKHAHEDKPMTDIIDIDIPGLDALLQKLGQLPPLLEKYLRAAGKEASNEVLDTIGVRRYPPSTAANAPPVPYYIRGRGMQTSANRNNLKSEKYGSRWSVTNDPYITTMTNNTSYAKYLGGDRQAEAMARIGWRKVRDVAMEKRAVLRDIYAAWVKKALGEFKD
jgi:hypothetical protein